MATEKTKKFYGGELDMVQLAEQAAYEASLKDPLAPEPTAKERYEAAVAAAEEANMAPIRAAQAEAARQKALIEEWEKENLRKRKEYTARALARQKARTELGTRLLMLREKSGLTQTQVGLLVNLNQGEISRIERGVWGFEADSERMQLVTQGYELAAAMSKNSPAEKKVAATG